MSKKNKVRNSNANGIVFSTDPNFRSNEETKRHEQPIEPAQQKLRVLIDKKKRAGKMVTIITGFIGDETDLEDLGKSLKTYCGSGGSVKDYEIIIQGDHRDKIVDWLTKKGFSNTRKI